MQRIRFSPLNIMPILERRRRCVRVIGGQRVQLIRVRSRMVRLQNESEKAVIIQIHLDINDLILTAI